MGPWKWSVLHAFHRGTGTGCGTAVFLCAHLPSLEAAVPWDRARGPLCDIVAAPGLLLQETSWMSKETAFYCSSVKTNCKSSPFVLQANCGSQLMKESFSKLHLKAYCRNIPQARLWQHLQHCKWWQKIISGCPRYRLGGAMGIITFYQFRMSWWLRSSPQDKDCGYPGWQPCPGEWFILAQSICPKSISWS